jgi:uncharacterized protein
VTLRWRKGEEPVAGVLPEIIGAGVLLVNNVLVHRALRPPADTALNVASAASLTALAMGTGCTVADLGLDRAHLLRGLRIGSVAAACCATCIGFAAALPTTRKFFLDLRLRDMSRKEALYHAGLRIPLATALTEEIMFRSALHALFARRHSLQRTLMWTSLIFGLWHILPTLDTVDREHASILTGDRARTRPLAAVGITGATAVAGLLFSSLRLRSGNVAASVLPHAAINITGFVVAKALVDRAGMP